MDKIASNDPASKVTLQFQPSAIKNPIVFFDINIGGKETVTHQHQHQQQVPP